MKANNPANISLFKNSNKHTRKKVWNMSKVNNKNTKTMCIPPENIRKPKVNKWENQRFSDVFRGCWRRSSAFIINSEDIS